MGYFIRSQKLIIHDFLILTLCTVLFIFLKIGGFETTEHFRIFPFIYIDLGEQKEELQKYCSHYILGKSTCFLIISYSVNTKNHSHFQEQCIFFWASEWHLLKSQPPVSGKTETFIHLPPGFSNWDQLSVRNLNSSLLLSQNSFAAVWEMKEEGANI